MLGQVPFVSECPDVILDRVSVRAGHPGRLADRHTSALTGEFQNLDREFRQVTQDDPLALYLLLEPVPRPQAPRCSTFP